MQYFKVLKNASYQTFARILTSGKGFLIAIILASVFGASGYGEFVKITSFVALFYLFIDFGINAIFLQVKDSERSFRTLLYLRLFISLLLFFIANFIAVFLPYDNVLGVGFSSAIKLGILIYSLEFFIQSVLFSTSAVFQKKLRYDYLTKSSAVGSALSLALVFLVVSLRLPLHAVMLALVVADFVAVSLSLFYTKERVLPVTLDLQLSQDLIRNSFPLGMVLVFNLIYFRVDNLILASFKPSGDVGIYGLSFLFFDFLLAIALFISNSVYPVLLSARDNKVQFLNLVRSYFFIYLGISFVVAIPFWFSTPLFSLIKPEFAPSIVPFRILLLGLPFFFLTSLLQWVLITKKKTDYLMKVYFLSMCANIFFNFIFIPQYSYMAAAFITGICEIIVFVFLLTKVVKLKHE